MSSILEAVSKGTDLKHFNERKERVPNNFDAKKADNDLRACPVCKVVWEVMIFNQTVDYKYYHNFLVMVRRKVHVQVARNALKTNTIIIQR